MIQILNVVAFCHLQGVVHRDLKPEVEYIHIISLPLEKYIDLCWSSPSHWNMLLQKTLNFFHEHYSRTKLSG